MINARSLKRESFPFFAAACLLCCKPKGWGFVLVLVFGFCLSGCVLNNIPQHPSDISMPEIEFETPSVQEWQLPNGMTVFYKYDDELPMVRGALYFHGGGLFEAIGDEGVSAFTGSQMREGGPVGMAPDDFDAQLDRLGASIESSFGAEFGSVGFFSLSQDFEEVFSLFSRIVQTPAFDRSRLVLAKKLALEGIYRRRDDPQTMLSISFSQLLYGADSPYGRVSTKESVDKISRDDLSKFHKRFVQPKGAHLFVVGAVPREEVALLVKERFGSWENLEAEKLPLSPPAINFVPKPGIYVLERDFDQARVALGHLGPPRRTEDQFKMSIFNRYFSYGSMGSLLFNEVRSRLGLAYSVSGGLRPGPVAGSFAVYLGTRSVKAMKAFSAIQELIQKVMVELPESEKIQRSIIAAKRSFVFKFEKSSSIPRRKVLLRMLSYPDNHDQLYLDSIIKVVPSDVREVAKRWIKPQEFVTVIVGNLNAEEISKAVGEQYDVYRLSFDVESHIAEKVGKSVD